MADPWYRWTSRGRNSGKTVDADRVARLFEERALIERAHALLQQGDNLIAYMSDDDRDVVSWKMEYGRWMHAFEELIDR